MLEFRKYTFSSDQGIAVINGKKYDAVLMAHVDYGLNFKRVTLVVDKENFHLAHPDLKSVKWAERTGIAVRFVKLSDSDIKRVKAFGNELTVENVVRVYGDR